MSGREIDRGDRCGLAPAPLASHKNEKAMNTIDLPTSEEKQRAVLMALQNGQHLTVQRCFREFHTTELRRIVDRLRKAGHNIVSVPVAGEKYHEFYLN